VPDVRTCVRDGELLDARHDARPPIGDVHIRQLLERARAIVGHQEDPVIIVIRVTFIVMESVEEPTCHIGRPSSGLIRA
jgi:hypothetical protein